MDFRKAYYPHLLMSDPEASAADAAVTTEQRNGQGLGSSEAITAQRSGPSTPSRKRKASKKNRRQRKRPRYESVSSESSESSDSSASDDSSEDSSSDESDTSSSSDSEEGENGIPSRARSENTDEDYVRFEVEVSSDRKLILPDDMSDYLTKKFSTFIPDKVLNEKIMGKFPIPSTSAVQTPDLDDYVPESFDATGSSYGKAFDSNLHQIQNRIGAVMGPISKLWVDLDEIRSGRSSGENLDPFEWLNVIEQSITLLGQAFSTTTYHRRMNVQYNLTKDVKKAKKLLKSNDANLSKGEKLFGKRFYKSLAKASKIRKKSKEISRQLGSSGDAKKNRNRNKSLSKRSQTTERPFPSGAPSRGARGGGRISFRARANASRPNRGKPRFSFYQHSSIKKSKPRQSKFGGKLASTGVSKNGVKSRSVTQCCEGSAVATAQNGLSSGRKTPTFSEQLENANSGRLHPSHSDRAVNPIFGNTDTSIVSLSRTEPKEFQFDRTGSSGNDFKESNNGSCCLPRSISEPCLSSSKEGWGTQTCNQSEKAKPVCRISTFQAGRDSGIKIPDKEGRFHGETRPERCLFRSVNFEISSQISPLLLEGENLRVPGPSI